MIQVLVSEKSRETTNGKVTQHEHAKNCMPTNYYYHSETRILNFN